MTSIESVNINVLLEGKGEYTKQLVYALAPEIFKGFETIYTDVLAFNTSKALRNFQIQLKQIKKWNQTILENETQRIQSKKPWIQELLNAVLVCNVKILSCIRVNPNYRSQFSLNPPSLQVFIHTVYIESARHLYEDPYLFDHRERNRSELHKRYNKIMEIIHEAIQESVRKIIPIESILREYLYTPPTDQIEEPQEDSEPEQEESDEPEEPEEFKTIHPRMTQDDSDPEVDSDHEVEPEIEDEVQVNEPTPKPVLFDDIDD